VDLRPRLTSSDAVVDIVLIGGPSTTGKSTLARAIGAAMDARVVDTDLFWMALQRLLPPEHDINLFRAADVWTLPADDLLARYLRVATVVCQAIEAVVLHYASIKKAAVIEGCWLLPDFAVQSEFAGYPVQAPIGALYLREPSLDQLAQQLLVRADGWHAEQPKAIQDAHALMQWRFGVEVNQRAKVLGLPVIDARPRATLVDRALQVLKLD
jgi:2-phosphoglycerate kinase